MEKYILSLTRKYKTNCPFTIAKNLNVHVRFVTLHDDVRGFYVRTLKRRFIAINNNLSEEWQRFVCAHELGHDRLHKEHGYYFIDRTLINPGKFERQANEFAVRLLVCGSKPEEGETKENYFKRVMIPVEMAKYI